MKLGSCAALMLGCALMLVLGCGPGGPATIPVTGKVTKGGVGIANVTVSLVSPTNTADAAAGTTDSTGAFTVSYGVVASGSVAKKGAPPGKYKVVLTGGGTAPVAGDANNKPTGYGAGGKTNAAPVLDTPYDTKWSNYETSPMEVEVKSGIAPLDIKVD